MNEQQLTILAELSALRAVLVRLQVLGLLSEPDPLAAARTMRAMLTERPTIPPAENPFDAATSDLLAGMTDERIEAIMDEVVAVLTDRLARAPA